MDPEATLGRQTPLVCDDAMSGTDDDGNDRVHLNMYALQP